MSRLQALEKRFKALEAEASQLEGMELQRGVAAGGGLSHDDIRMLLEGLVSRREAALKEDFHKELDLHVQVGEPAQSLACLVCFITIPQLLQSLCCVCVESESMGSMRPHAGGLVQAGVDRSGWAMLVQWWDERR